WLIPEEGAIGSPQTFQVIANSPEPELALAFLNYVLSAPTQARWANDMYYAIVNKNAKLDPKIARYVPEDKLFPLDSALIGAKRAEWTNRFNREILGQ
ncbi:MAG: extracellular solute-binding protein, partial [Spirochaetota bacterium]